MRNGTVEVFRFLFCIIICLYHFYGFGEREYWVGGAIAVSYFVIASVVFLLDGWERKKNTLDKHYPYKFLKKRFLRFFPYTTVAFLTTFLVRRIYINLINGEVLSFPRIITWLSGDLWEILLVDMAGFNDNAALLNVPIWSISAMLLTEFILVACLVYGEDKFSNLIAPISMMVGFGLWRHAESAHPKLWAGFTTYGMIRIWVLSCLGYYCWKLYRRIREKQFTKPGRWTLTICELSCYAIVIPIMYFFSSYNFYWAATLLMIPAFAITVSGKSYTSKLFPSTGLTTYLGELSFSIYLTHYQLLSLYHHFWPESDDMNAHIAVGMAMILAVGIVYHHLLKVLAAYGRKRYRHLKGKLVAADPDAM